MQTVENTVPRGLKPNPSLSVHQVARLKPRPFKADKTPGPEEFSRSLFSPYIHPSKPARALAPEGCFSGNSLALRPFSAYLSFYRHFSHPTAKPICTILATS